MHLYIYLCIYLVMCTGNSYRVETNVLASSLKPEQCPFMQLRHILPSFHPASLSLPPSTTICPHLFFPFNSGQFSKRLLLGPFLVQGALSILKNKLLLDGSEPLVGDQTPDGSCVRGHEPAAGAGFSGVGRGAGRRVPTEPRTQDRKRWGVFILS